MDNFQGGEALLLGASLSIVKERVSWTLVKMIMILLRALAIGVCSRRKRWDRF